MTTRDTPWPAGTPCWIDLMTTDASAASEFYAALFGWEVPPGAEEFGGYSTATLNGKTVAGVMPMMDSESHPPVWSTYLATDDADATTAAVEKAGGSILSPAMDVGEFGRMVIAQAPGGGAFGYWQANSHTGFQIANETGADIWNQFLCRDYAGAKDFYAKVFGYTYTEIGDGDMQYALIEVNGETVGGLGALPAEVPAGVPPHWRVFFAVDDADAAADKIAELGGAVQRPPTDMPYGRSADVADPQGAMFSIIKPASPE
jgi:predicted enzyme related to lactoylglutathione lyase